MKIGGVSLFQRTNSRGRFNLASFHSRHSLTWSWILSLGLSNAWRLPNGWLRFAFSPYRTNGGLQWVLVLPFVELQWHRQREMWFRDMFNRAREREDALERTVSRLRRELARTRELADTPARGPVQ